MLQWAAKMDEKIDMKVYMSFMEHDKDMNGGVDMNEMMEAMKMIDANGMYIFMPFCVVFSQKLMARI